jgi:Saxitoxin biosynthesis operon protein SxtJ
MATVLEPSLARGPVPESSDRSFGLVFAAVFAAVGLLPLLRLEQPRWWAIGIAAAFALLAVVWPDLLRPLNRAWLGLGRLLHRVVSPLVMSAVFFLCVTPVAWIMRLRGKDVLSLARRPDLSSYWIAREPSPPPAETMKRQF